MKTASQIQDPRNIEPFFKVCSNQTNCEKHNKQKTVLYNSKMKCYNKILTFLIFCILCFPLRSLVHIRCIDESCTQSSKDHTEDPSSHQQPQVFLVHGWGINTFNYELCPCFPARINQASAALLDFKNWHYNFKLVFW